MDLFTDLVKHIQNASYILVAGHVSPDGDAIGACTAMGHMLEAMGKDYTILLEKIDDRYDYLFEHVNVATEVPEKDCDLFIALDCADIGRLGSFKEVHDKAAVAWNIDHHISNNNYSKFNHVDSNASSASEIVFNIYEVAGIDLNPQSASAIYTGIVYDTAAFKHSNTSPRTLAVASELLKQAFDFSSIIQMMFYEQSLLSMQLQGAALGNMEVFYDNAFVMSSLSMEEILAYTEEVSGTGGIVNVLKNMKDSKVALFLYEKTEGQIKVSMRSEDPYDISKVAQVFGGGGHKKAAGATISGTLQEAKDQITPLLKDLFK